MFKKLTDLFSRRHDYSSEDQTFIEGLQLEASALQSISEMKATGGWKILSTKLREELHSRIHEKVKGDEKINVILGILSTVETVNATKLLADEIDKIIPN